MTLQSLFTLFVEYRAAVLLLLFFAPWLALGLCIAIPGRREEPFILNFNLAMACLSLLMAVGYLMYATNTGGWTRVVQEADLLLMLAPCYYVGVSLWVTRQRLPLDQVPAFRAMQGLALIGAGYLGVAWFLSKVRFLIFSYLPFPVLLLLFLGLVAVIYMGYLRLTGKDAEHPPSSRESGTKAFPDVAGIDDELERLRRNLNSDE
jgi:hypothetical protein